MPHILVTNDDGVDAPGLLALAQALRQLEGVEVSVLAPDRNWSVSGHVKTLHRPLRVWEVELDDGSRALTTDGAPSDCVALAMLGLLERQVDMVVSGINAHANLGHDVTYSGTVTAAMEAVISGVPGIAVSLDNPYEPGHRADYRPAAEIARRVVAWVLGHGLPQGILLNVNVPLGTLEDIRGVKITRMGLRVYRDRLIKRLDPAGRPYYWIGAQRREEKYSPGIDLEAISRGAISITPLTMDLTHGPTCIKLKARFK